MPSPTFDAPSASCHLCKSTDLKLLMVDFKGIEIHQCKHCKVQFMNPQYTDKYLDEFYSNFQSYDSNHQRYGNVDQLKEYLHALNIADVERYTAQGKFLSVGCGSGHDVIQAKKRGWKAEGFEVDPEFSQQLSEKIDAPIRSGEFIDLDYANQEFDCVYLSHVIEHPKNPDAYLEKCHSLLRKGGILYIACPNIVSFSIQIKKALEILNLRRKKGSYFDTWHHLFYYSPSVMKNLLESQFGFKVLMMANDRKFRAGQSEFSKKFNNTLAYTFPYKASFRLIAKKV